MTSSNPSHIPSTAAREKHVGGLSAVQTQHRSDAGSKHVTLATIPDLRFEQSYLKSIAPYVQTRRVAGSAGGEECREAVGVRWKQVLWITTRDQLASPLLQGAVWGVAQPFVRSFFAGVRAFFARAFYGFFGFFGFFRFFKQTASRDSHVPVSRQLKSSGDGELTLRLREWAKDFEEDI
ncbi:uncharacterized protein FOMMEDRAFT_171602 [Fomitiporia mediterranea MF3/22]|uniref:Transmembrane protein n=1 Tax=Fomitiporia mediterranea (strain MF3/22) TaxID=694068 RepID=R7SG32_FOMME|nr:uncharacterized protein FOMMEDRAFT_171602 [Fomitiporia mediterranea MF3/22]EJC97676.1 hypothetical protein FOMMEDRAFT_171602 [Fomitiporia mediterranea MF3/22]